MNLSLRKPRYLKRNEYLRNNRNVSDTQDIQCQIQYYKNNIRCHFVRLIGGTFLLLFIQENKSKDSGENIQPIVDTSIKYHYEFMHNILLYQQILK